MCQHSNCKEGLFFNDYKILEIFMAVKILIEIVLVMTFCILAGGYHNPNIRMFVCKRF
jgi:hypothetical protein